ncbi:MAG: amidase, partial [Firmicutes bacterium]|nr:amidase [Bacillota bacterium]
MNNRPKTSYREDTGLMMVSIILIAAIFVTCFYFLPLDKGMGDMDGPGEEQGEISITFAVRSLEDLFTTPELQDATISQLQAEMEAGNLTAEQLTQMYIDRILAYDKALDLNSVIAINPSALEEARELDAKRAAGEVLGPLHGIPVIVKANIDVEGMATTAGARVLADMVVREDACIVRRLKEQGAVILGQANMSEFAYATASSRSTLGGIVHNAYDTTRTPGGSSGGSAVAVTCNFAAAGIGTDTGGSIRNPSSFSNLYGMRPSKGLTSISGVFPLKAYKDTVGPMTRTAEDMALIMEAISGGDKDDDYTLEARANVLLGDGYVDDLSEDGLEGMRIGYLTYSFKYGRSVPSDSVQKMLENAIANLEAAGAEIVDVSDVLTQEMIWGFNNGLNTETFEYDVNKYLSEKGDSTRFKTVRDIYYSNFDGNMHMYLDNITAWYAYFAKYFESTYDPYTEMVGNYERVPGWTNMLNERETIARLMEENDIDAVMYLNFFDVSVKEQAHITDPYNAAGYDIIFGPKHGLPEISLPMGFAETDGGHDKELPLGLFIFSSFGEEETLLKLAYAYELQAGEDIRRVPDIVPPLEDTRLNAFLSELINSAYALTDKEYEHGLEPKVQNMLTACKKAEEVDRRDPSCPPLRLFCMRSACF